MLIIIKESWTILWFEEISLFNIIFMDLISFPLVSVCIQPSTKLIVFVYRLCVFKTPSAYCSHSSSGVGFDCSWCIFIKLLCWKQNWNERRPSRRLIIFLIQKEVNVSMKRAQVWCFCVVIHRIVKSSISNSLNNDKLCECQYMRVIPGFYILKFSKFIFELWA